MKHTQTLEADVVADLHDPNKRHIDIAIAVSVLSSPLA